MYRVGTIALILAASTALAGPAVQPGDFTLRHDIQRLADYGCITGPASTWPLEWELIMDEIRSFTLGEDARRHILG